MRPGRLSTGKIVQSIIYRICEYLPFIRIVWLFVRGNQERDENPTIEELLDIAAGHPGINIDMWEYESLFGTF